MNQDCYGIGYGIIVRLRANKNWVALSLDILLIPSNSIASPFHPQDIGARMMVMSYGSDTQQYLDCIEQGMRDMVTVASGKNF